MKNPPELSGQSNKRWYTRLGTEEDLLGTQQEEETYYTKEESPVTHIQASLWSIYSNTVVKVWHAVLPSHAT